MKILPIIKPRTSCDYHRLVQPLKYLGINTEIDNKQIPHLIKDAEIVIFNRWAGFPIENLLRAKKKLGFKIVCDLDDYFELYPNHVMYKSWETNEMSRKIQEAILNSDLVFVTTKRLADVVCKLNNNVEIIPNGLPFDREQFTVNNKQNDTFEFLYVAGTSHFWDLLSLKNLFYLISREDLRKKIRTSLAGYSDRDKSTASFWKSMENIITANKRIDYIRRYGVDVNEYMNLYDGASCSIAPLEDNYFNRFKSNLKILEAGCKNMPIIVSNVPPYSDEDTDLVLKASSTKDWYMHMKYLVENPEYAKELGLKLGEYVRKNYDLEKINEKRKQIFEHLCKQ